MRLTIPSYYKPTFCWPWQAWRAGTAYSKEYKKLVAKMQPEIEKLRQEYYPKAAVPLLLWAVSLYAIVGLSAFAIVGWVFKVECHPEAILRIFCP